MNFSLIDTVKPFDVDCRTLFFDTSLPGWRAELVARNIVFMCRHAKNRWIGFTLEDYIERCFARRMTLNKCQIDEHLAELNELVFQQFLTLKKGRFTISNLFMVAISRYVPPAILY